MFKFPNPKTEDPEERKIQRILEMIPGSLTWITILGMFLTSFYLPFWAAAFVIAFDMYWIYRTIFISFYSIKAFRKLQVGKKIDWYERCQYAKKPEVQIAILRERMEKMEMQLKKEKKRAEKKLIKKKIVICKESIKEAQELIPIKSQIWDWQEIFHVVMLPTAGEPAEVIEPAIQAVAESVFPRERIIVLLATEEREPEEKRSKKVNYLKEKFRGVFYDFIVTTHVVGAGEMKCKGSNATYAARQLMKYLDEKGIKYEKVVFSNFDCDSVCHPQYFSALTYGYVTSPNRLQRCYQPIPVYHNNIWDTNAFVRVIVTSSSFWHMYQSTRKEMVTFSSHSEPFDTLVKVDFWPINVISEDSIIYWKCYSYYHGNYQVLPIYLPISLDAVLAESYFKTIANQYKQKRRWAYGIENFPIIMRAIWNDRKIKMTNKIKTAFEILEGHHSWATASLILAFLGWLPLIIGGSKFNESVLAHNLPFITRYLMTIAMVGLVISIFLSFFMLPERPKRCSKKLYVYMLFQWFLVPIIGLFLGAFPAIDSQTRILFKKYFGEFWVTDKMKK